MDNQQYNDSGILFRNRDKKSDKHPDFSGELNIACDLCHRTFVRRLAAWVKVGRAGKFLALSCKPRPAQADARHQDAGPEF